MASRPVLSVPCSLFLKQKGRNINKDRKARLGTGRSRLVCFGFQASWRENTHRKGSRPRGKPRREGVSGGEAARSFQRGSQVQ